MAPTKCTRKNATNGTEDNGSRCCSYDDSKSLLVKRRNTVVSFDSSLQRSWKSFIFHEHVSQSGMKNMACMIKHKLALITIIAFLLYDQTNLPVTITTDQFFSQSIFEVVFFGGFVHDFFFFWCFALEIVFKKTESYYYDLYIATDE